MDNERESFYIKVRVKHGSTRILGCNRDICLKSSAKEAGKKATAAAILGIGEDQIDYTSLKGDCSGCPLAPQS